MEVSLRRRVISRTVMAAPIFTPSAMRTRSCASARPASASATPARAPRPARAIRGRSARLRKTRFGGAQIRLPHGHLGGGRACVHDEQHVAGAHAAPGLHIDARRDSGNKGPHGDLFALRLHETDGADAFRGARQRSGGRTRGSVWLRSFAW